LCNGYTLVQVQILPFPWDSFVTVQTPLNADLTAFWLGGTWLCIAVGIISAFFHPKFPYHWLGFGLSVGLIGNGMIAPLFSFFGTCDFTMIDYNWGLWTFCMAVILILCVIYIGLRGLKHG